jgi:hypothetical protein
MPSQPSDPPGRSEARQLPDRADIGNVLVVSQDAQPLAVTVRADAGQPDDLDLSRAFPAPVSHRDIIAQVGYEPCGKVNPTQGPHDRRCYGHVVRA